MNVHWNFTGSTRRGRSHFRNSLPNQDAIAHHVSVDGRTAIVAVADGHGSEVHFRSDVGSKLAVGAAVRVLERFAGRDAADPGVLANELVGCWRESVQTHWNAHPLTADDDRRLVAGTGWSGRAAVRDHPTLAYGSTVVAVAATPGRIVCLQIGDGQVLLVDADGRTRPGVGPDRRMRRGRTASLGHADPESFVRIGAHPRHRGHPVLVLAATDGHCESYPKESDFVESGKAWLDAARTEDPEGFAGRVDRFLDEAHHRGSPDDITLGFLVDREGLRTQAAAPNEAVTVRRGTWEALRRRAGFPSP